MNNEDDQQYKLGILILCHTDPRMVVKLIKRLVRSDNIYCFVHVDAKIDQEPFYVNHKRVYYSKERYDVRWGGFNAIRATDRLVELAYQQGMDRFILNQGLDYPIKPNKEIIKFFQSNCNVEYIRSCNITQSTIKKLKQKVTLNWEMNNLTTLKKIIRKLALLIDWHSQHDYVETEARNMDVYYGSATWAITRGAANEVLSFRSNGPFRQYMQRVFAPDEEYYQTIIQNSSFKKNVIGGSEMPSTKLVNFKNLTYYEYPDGVTKVFTIDDFNKLKESKFLFARKVTSIASGNLVKELDKLESRRCDE